MVEVDGHNRTLFRALAKWLDVSSLGGMPHEVYNLMEVHLLDDAP